MAVELERWERLFAERTRSGHGNALAAVLALANVREVISFAGGFPEPATFPVERFQELFAGLDATAFQYAPTAGLPGIRDFLAGRLDPRPEEGGLMVTSGSIEALELCGKALLEPGDRVVVEGPTYMGAIMSFQSFEADVAAVHMDEQGMDVEALDGLRPKLVYTIPDYQNPMGVSMSAERRRALVELARRDGFLVVEDVAYRELGWEEHQPPSLWSLGPDVVLQAGTFSKIFFPGVRLGWAAGPPEVVARLVWASSSPTSAPAPSASGCSRSTGAAGGSTSRSRRRGRSTGSAARRRSPPSTVTSPAAPNGRGPQAGSSPG